PSARSWTKVRPRAPRTDPGPRTRRPMPRHRAAQAPPRVPAGTRRAAVPVPGREAAATWADDPTPGAVPDGRATRARWGSSGRPAGWGRLASFPRRAARRCRRPGRRLPAGPAAPLPGEALPGKSLLGEMGAHEVGARGA